MSTTARRRLAGAVALLALAGAAAGPSAAPASAGGLLPNGGFEESAIGPVGDAARQGVLPTGWAFEGSAGLFDHGNGGAGGSARFAGISIPAGGKSAVCGPTVGCTPPVIGQAKDVTDHAYSVDPAWRNAVPVAVQAGRGYTLAADMAWNIVTDGEGAFGKVRWLSAGGTVLKVDTAFDIRANAATSFARDWGRVSGGVTAPAGAAFAVVLLGATDDIWISQVKFDNAYFG